MAISASALDFSMRSGSLRIPPTLMRRNVFAWSTYSAPAMRLPAQNASSPTPAIGLGGLACSPSSVFSRSDGWNCRRQYALGVILELGVPRVPATAMLTDRGDDVARKHCDISTPPAA